MDLSNLSNNLPPTSPISEESLQELSDEITANFKDAAKSVAALYRLSHSKNTQLVGKGYLDCLNDVLKVISNGDDVEDWVLMKKNELTRVNKTEVPVTSDIENDPTQIEQDTNDTSDIELKRSIFKMDNVTTAPFKFPPSMVPLSMNHSNLQHYVARPKKSSKLMIGKLGIGAEDIVDQQQQHQHQQQQDVSEEDEEEELIFDDNKRKYYHENNASEKKLRFN